MCHFFFFFFQAEDGIRDLTVTGVQTCALPISMFAPWARSGTIEWQASPSTPARPSVQRSTGGRNTERTRLDSTHRQTPHGRFCLQKTITVLSNTAPAPATYHVAHRLPVTSKFN